MKLASPPHNVQTSVALLIRRYGALSPLRPEDEDVLREIEGPLDSVDSSRELLVEGAASPTARFLISGWACRFRMLGDGRRQILSFILPGDGIAVCQRPNPIALANITTLTPCMVVNAGPHLQMGWTLDRAPGLAAALRIAEALDEAHLVNQAVRLGRQSALERVSHLLLELHWRLDQIGFTDGWQFPAPLTQETLADASGLSIVHVNRTIQQLRRERLIEWRNHTVTITEPTLLADLAEFKPPLAAAWR